MEPNPWGNPLKAKGPGTSGSKDLKDITVKAQPKTQQLVKEEPPHQITYQWSRQPQISTLAQKRVIQAAYLLTIQADPNADRILIRYLASLFSFNRIALIVD